MLIVRHGMLAHGDDEPGAPEPYDTKALSKKLVYFGGSSDSDKKFVTKTKMNVTRQVRPDGVMTDIFEVVGNNVGRDEQIAQMLLTRGLVGGRRATARSKVMPLEDGQKREALIQVRMEERHRQRGDMAGEVGAPLLNECSAHVCVFRVGRGLSRPTRSAERL